MDFSTVWLFGLVWFASPHLPQGSVLVHWSVVLNLRWGRQWGFLMLKRVILKHVHIVKCLWSQAPHGVLEKHLCISLQKWIDKWFLLKYVKTETHTVVSVHLKAKLYNQSLLIQSWFQDAENNMMLYDSHQITEKQRLWRNSYRLTGYTV